MVWGAGSAHVGTDGRTSRVAVAARKTAPRGPVAGGVAPRRRRRHERADRPAWLPARLVQRVLSADGHLACDASDGARALGPPVAALAARRGAPDARRDVRLALAGHRRDRRLVRLVRAR